MFRSKFRVLTLISLAFLTQCCCIILPFSIETSRPEAEQPAAVQAVAAQPIVEQIIERIEAVIAFDR